MLLWAAISAFKNLKSNLDSAKKFPGITKICGFFVLSSNTKPDLKKYTKTGIQAAESKYGVRYSVLMSLPYYDPVNLQQ